MDVPISSFINETLKSFTEEFTIWKATATAKLSIEKSIEQRLQIMRMTGTFKGREIIALRMRRMKLLLFLDFPRQKVLAKITTMPAASPAPSRSPTCAASQRSENR